MLQGQVWAMKKPLFFWESEAGFETFQRFFLHVGVSYKHVFKSSKSLNVTCPVHFNVGKRLKNAKFLCRIQNHFSQNRRQFFEPLENVFCILDFSTNLF